MNPYDGTAATVVPQNIEKLPLFHWRPGARLLAVGSRDGADFAGDLHTDRTTFRRAVAHDLLVEAQAKQRLDGIVATWSESLAHPLGMATLRAARRGALVVATPGTSSGTGSDNGALLADLLPEVDAWLLLCTATPGPLAERIIAGGRHVEVLLGLAEGAAVPELPWDRVSAVHLCATRPAEADNLDAWCVTARAALAAVVPATVRIYDPHHPHTDCSGCGERLVWRHSGRSRIDGITAGACARCGAPSPLVLA